MKKIQFYIISKKFYPKKVPSNLRGPMHKIEIGAGNVRSCQIFLGKASKGDYHAR